MTRATKFTDEARRIVLESMRINLFAEQAAHLAGVNEKTLDDWLSRGRKGEKTYAEFVREFEIAKATGERASVARIQKAAAGGQWQADAWILERRHPKRWGPKVRVIVEEEQREFLDRLRARLSPETYAAVIHAADDDGDDGDVGTPDEK
jgi:hypothetical protein